MRRAIASFFVEQDDSVLPPLPLIDSDRHLFEVHGGKGGSEGVEIIPVADRLLNRFGEGSIASLSTDKGFSSKEDRELLELFIDEVMMPKKGRKNAIDEEREREPRWLKLKDQHSEVESNINSLEHHGLDRCPGAIVLVHGIGAARR